MSLGRLAMAILAQVVRGAIGAQATSATGS